MTDVNDSFLTLPAYRACYVPVMATEPDRGRDRQTRPLYLGVRVNGEVRGPVPTADRLRMVNPSGQTPWVEWRYNGRTVGYGPCEDDS
jgi:hypothetical protein